MDTIHYRGAYRFSDRDALDGALATALADQTHWRAQFVAYGSALRVALDLPALAREQRLAASRVMQTLAYLAVEGIVVARQRELAIDVFVCGE